MAKKRWGTRLTENRVLDLLLLLSVKTLVYSVVVGTAVWLAWLLGLVFSTIFHPPLAADLSAGSEAAMFWIRQNNIVGIGLLTGTGLVSFLIGVVLVEIVLNKLDELTEGIRGGR
jgi:hypothetical protein